MSVLLMKTYTVPIIYIKISDVVSLESERSGENYEFRIQMFIYTART